MRNLVLVVARETALRAKIARLLQPAGYAVELAANEKRALALIARENIVAAVVVPGAGLAGLALARQVSHQIPKLIVLAERPDDVARLGRSLPGAVALPLDPLDEAKLLDCVAELMASPGSDETAPTPAA